MWINSCLYCQVVVPVISSRPRTIFIFLISSQSTDYRFHFIISLRPAIVCWSPHLLRAGPGLWNVIWEGNGSDWQCIDWLGGWGVGWGWGRTKNGSKCFLWFGIQQAACTSLHTALAPSADFWYRLTGRGGGGLLAAVPRAETTQPSQPQPPDTLSNSVHPSALACQYAMRTRAWNEG